MVAQCAAYPERVASFGLQSFIKLHYNIVSCKQSFIQIIGRAMNLKFKTFLMSVVCVFLFFQNTNSAISGRGYVLEMVKTEEDTKKFGKQNAEYLKQELAEDPTRFLAVPTTGGLTFNKTAFYAPNYFYLGANSNGAQSSALMRAAVQLGATPSENEVKLVDIAPEKALLNGEENKDNPIYDKKVSNLSLMGRYPVLTLENATQVNGTDFDANKLICLVDDPESGGSVKTNTEQLKDAAGADTAGVVGLAASQSQIFAAVKPNVGNFGAAYSGILLVKQEEKKLQGAAQATALNLTACGLVARDQDAKFIDVGDMYWDSTLQRLYIGLKGVQRTQFGHGQQDKVCALLIGRIDDAGVLVLDSIVNLDTEPSLFVLNDNKFIFGFNYNNDSLVCANVLKIRTMHTSTGKSYLIVNGAAVRDNFLNRVYALPLLQKTEDGDGAVEANVGKIAKRTDLSAIIAARDDMTQSNQVPAKVGNADNLPIRQTQRVQDMFVVGDSVFCCVAQDSGSADQEAGIFKSTALFDADGKIRAWTAWQRVMGSVDKVYGAGFDDMQGNYWYLTQDDAANKNTVKVTQWGKSVAPAGGAQAGMMGNGLVDLLNKEFVQEVGGVHQIFNFDEQTPSLARTDEANKKSIMVATGFGKVALVQSGAVDAVRNVFTPTQDAFERGTNVFVFEDDALDNIGPICCAEVSRRQAECQGWLFVGGYDGLAVLRQADGNGWDGRADQDAVNFATVGEYTFKELVKADGSFSGVKKLVSQGDSLYVLTADKLYRFQMNSNKFTDAGGNALDEQEIQLPAGVPLDMIVYRYAASNIRLLVATTEGLFYSGDDIEAVLGAIYWEQLLSGPVVHLNFISRTKGGATTDGNLYALAADFSLNLAAIYRFNVVDGNITAIPESSGSDYFYSIGELRTNFVTDGALGYHMLSKHFGKTDFLKRISMISTQSSIRSGENVLDLDLDENAYNIGVMVQNTASGAWVVPGDWGIRVNE
jgi:hypothetical protein